VTARPLYLHETIDIVGQGAAPYMEKSVVGFDADRVADRGLTLFGTWQVQGSTGRWPQVINLWELVDGWEGWRRLCQATNLKRESNEGLRTWWDEAAAWRSGGFDRLLGALPGSRDLSAITESGEKGELFVHEIAEVRPGTAPEYGRFVQHDVAPALARYDHRLVGVFESLLDDSEVISLWAASLDGHIELQRAREAARGFGDPSEEVDSDLIRIDEASRATRVRRREEMMIPCPGSPMGPDAWQT